MGLLDDLPDAPVPGVAQGQRVPSRPPFALGPGVADGKSLSTAYPSSVVNDPDILALFPLGDLTHNRAVDPDRKRRDEAKAAGLVYDDSSHTWVTPGQLSLVVKRPKEQFIPINAETAQQIELALADDIAAFAMDPAGYIWYAFPWGQPNTALSYSRPRKWTLEVCESIRAKLEANHAKPTDAWDVIAEAVASGHGIGKSAFIAQLVMWAMSTMEHTRGVITANTDNQLRTKLWPEIAKWHALAINKHWFDVTATKIHHVNHEQSWFINAVPWSLKNLEAFQGLHNQGRRIVLAMEEASGIEDMVWETAEGAMTDEATEIIWLAFGNPTRAKGRFRDCWNKFRELWTCRNIDSRTVEGINKSRITRWARIYGEMSQFFKIRVAGQFADADPNQLIPLEWIASARERQFNMVMGDGGLSRLRVTVDVADGGNNDTVITVARHWSSISVILLQKKYRFAPSVAPIEAADEAERLFVRYGGKKGTQDDLVVDAIGVGSGTAGTLIKRNYSVVRFVGGAQSANPVMWRNRRVQHYLVLRDTFRDGFIVLAPDMCEDVEQWDEFIAQLTSIRTKPGTEAKEDLQSKEELRKERGASDDWQSPDCADSLMMQYGTQAPKLVPGVVAYGEARLVTSPSETRLAMEAM